MTTTKEYRIELRNALRPMDGTEKLKALAALRHYVALEDGNALPVAYVGCLGQYVAEAQTLGHVSRLIGFLSVMVPCHVGAENRAEAEATLDAMEDLLQENRDRRKGARGDGDEE